MKARKFSSATARGRCLLFALSFIFTLVSANALGQDPDPGKLLQAQQQAPVLAAPVAYHLDLSNTPFSNGDGIQGITASANIFNPATWEYYRFCAIEGDTVTIETHRTTSAMDPTQMICQGTTADSTGISAFDACGPDMTFVAAADDNNGIPHAVGGIWADPKNVFTAPATSEYTLMVFDFWPAGSPPEFEIHVDGVVPCSLSKEITSGPDEDQANGIDVVVPVKPDETLEYDFTITYVDPAGPPVLVIDTVPAEWIVWKVDDTEIDGNEGDDPGIDACGEEWGSGPAAYGEAEVFKYGKKGKKCKSATEIGWMPVFAGARLKFDVMTRPSPGKGHGRKGEAVFAPTSCGPLYLNDGAIAFEKDEFGELVLDPQGNPVVVAGPTPPLCLAAVSQDLLDALPEYDANADHDADGLASYAEACGGVTDPCIADTDGDGVLDGADECPLEGPPNAALGQLLDGAGCIFQSQCSDTLDNDSDNVTDFNGGDPSCDDIIDNTEDNDDEDGDGLLDGDEITKGTDPVSPTSVLYEDSGGGGFTCVAGVNDTGGTVYGYADYANTAGTLSVDVILSGVNASDNYGIWVNQANSGNEGDPNDDCPTLITPPVVATDGSGDGMGSVSEAVNGSSDVVWISAVGTGAPVLLRSTAQPIPPP